MSRAFELTSNRVFKTRAVCTPALSELLGNSNECRRPFAENQMDLGFNLELCKLMIL